MTQDEAIKVLREALDLAMDLATTEAHRVHEAYAGYKPNKHRAADADVELMNQASAALEILKAQLAARIEPAEPVAYLVDWHDIGEGTGKSVFYDVDAKKHMESAVSYAKNARQRPATVTLLYAAPQPIAQPAPSVPDGWKLAPVWPTQEMSDAGSAAMAGGPTPMTKVYRAMLAAAPKQNDGGE